MPVDFTEFYNTEIEGIPFRARFIGDQAYIESPSRNTWDGVAIASSTKIRFLSKGNNGITPDQEGWWVVKWDWQPRIDLRGLSAEGRALLAQRFGLEYECHEPACHGRPFSFEKSDAFYGLCEWARSNPRLAKHSAFCKLWVYLCEDQS
jgi:hypothetical protein